MGGAYQVFNVGPELKELGTNGSPNRVRTSPVESSSDTALLTNQNRTGGLSPAAKTSDSFCPMGRPAGFHVLHVLKEVPEPEPVSVSGDDQPEV